jgi:branched-chain amino acid transport system substrate-binding protein
MANDVKAGSFYMNGSRWKVCLSGVLLLTILALSSCGSGGTVKIGVIRPVEGSLSDYGFQLDNGIRLAWEDVKANKSNGEGEKLIRRNYELIFKNEPSDLSKIKDVFEELRAEGVIAIIGAASSAATLELAPLANKHKIILLSPASSSPEINTDNNDYVFRNYPSDTLEAQKLSNVIFQKCFIQKCLMVRARSAYGEGITFELLKFARQNSKKMPNEVVKFKEDIEEVDFVAVVDRIVDINPTGVFIGAYTDQIIPLLTEIRERPELEDLYIFTSSAFLPEKVIASTDEATVEGVMFTGYEWDPRANDPGVQEFVQKFEALSHATPPTIYAATGYDAVWILVRAIEEADHLLADEIRGQLLSINDFNGVMGFTDFNKRGDVTRIPVMYKMTSGLKVEVTDEDTLAIKNNVLSRVD